MRSLIILPAFLATFASAVLFAVLAFNSAIEPDMRGAAPAAALSGTAPENPAAIAIDEAQY